MTLALHLARQHPDDQPTLRGHSLRSMKATCTRTCVRHQDAHVWPCGCCIIVTSLPPGSHKLIGFHRRRSGSDHKDLLRSVAMLHCCSGAYTLSCCMHSIQTQVGMQAAWLALQYRCGRFTGREPILDVSCLCGTVQNAKDLHSSVMSGSADAVVDPADGSSTWRRNCITAKSATARQ